MTSSNVRAGTEIKVATERPSLNLTLTEMDRGSWVIFELPGFTAAAEGLPPHQVAQHAHHFRTLLIDSQRIEVGYFHIRVRTHRMGHGAGILGKLHGAEHGCILHPLDGTRSHIR